MQTLSQKYSASQRQTANRTTGEGESGEREFEKQKIMGNLGEELKLTTTGGSRGRAVGFLAFWTIGGHLFLASIKRFQD